MLLGVPPLGATITLHRVARVCQRQLGFLVNVGVLYAFRAEGNYGRTLAVD